MKIASINTIAAVIYRIKERFAERRHLHEISDIDGLQRKIDELTPPSEIETSADVIIKLNQLSFAVSDLADEINILNATINALTPAIEEIYITTSSENPSVKFGGT